MTRYRIGASLLIASAVLIVVQVITALAWPDGYSITRNAISDLGVTVCGEFAEQGRRLATSAHLCMPSSTRAWC